MHTRKSGLSPCPATLERRLGSRAFGVSVQGMPLSWAPPCRQEGRRVWPWFCGRVLRVFSYRFAQMWVMGFGPFPLPVPPAPSILGVRVVSGGFCSLSVGSGICRDRVAGGGRDAATPQRRGRVPGFSRLLPASQ